MHVEMWLRVRRPRKQEVFYHVSDFISVLDGLKHPRIIIQSVLGQDIVSKALALTISTVSAAENPNQLLVL